MSSVDRFNDGLAVRREVLGEDYVRASLGADGAEPTAMQQLVTEFGWGFVWSRPELPRHTRSLITVALLTALNRPHELVAHTRGALNNKCTPEEIREVMIHSAAYCGIPASLDAMRIVEGVIAEDGPTT
jgi:4-carboxymuconolactone decarboxylase